MTFAQPDPNHRETMAGSLRYELGLSEEQVDRLEAAEEEFLKDYHLGIIRFKTKEEHQTGYFAYFRPLLEPKQQEKLDVVVQQYEEMLQGMEERKVKKGKDNLRKRFADLYLTAGQVDSLYEALRKPELSYQEQAELVIDDKRTYEQRLQAEEEGRVRAILTPKQFLRYEFIVAAEQEQVLQLQAEFIQSQYPSLQLSMEQGAAIHEFQAYNEGIGDKGETLGYWETQDQRRAFMKNLLDPDQFYHFQTLQEKKIQHYERGLAKEEDNLSAQLDFARQRLDFAQNTTLPALLDIRKTMEGEISKQDKKVIAELRRRYEEHVKQEVKNSKIFHEKNYRTYQMERLEMQVLDLERQLLLPQTAALREESLKAQIAELTERYLPLINQHDEQLAAIDQASQKFTRDHFVLPTSWFTSFKYFPEKTPQELDQEKVMRVLLLKS